MGDGAKPGRPKISRKCVIQQRMPSFDVNLALKRVAKMGEVSFKVHEETARRTKTAIMALDKVIEKHIDPLIDREGAEFLKEAMRKKKGEFGVQDVKGVELLEGVKRLLRRHMFKGMCPVCRGGGCGDCRGRGWVTNAMSAEIMKKMRESE